MSYCWITANNFCLHSTITENDCVFEHVHELEKERAVAGANNARPLFISLAASDNLPYMVRCLLHTG